ncbi:MAG: hypothetical protein ACKO3W_15360 [bacterium]
MSPAEIARGTGGSGRPEVDLSLGALTSPVTPRTTIRASGPSDRGRGFFPERSAAERLTSPLAISIALVGANRAGCIALPSARLDELAVLGARRALEACRAHRVRVTFLVPGASVERHAALVRQLAEEHEIGLFGFDPMRAGPDDPLRARERLEAAIGVAARWYAPPFGAPASPIWIDAAGLQRVPSSGNLRLGPVPVPIERALAWPSPVAALLLRRAVSRSTAALHLPLVAGSFAEHPAVADLPRTLRPPRAPDLGMLVRAASIGA